MLRDYAAAPVFTVVSFLLLGCQIEQTPDGYFDHEDSIESERAAAGGELRDRLLAFGGALARGDADEALTALHPASDIRVLGPMEGLDIEGIAAVRALLDRLAGTPVAIRMGEVEVQTGPAANIAWFTATIEAPGPAPEPNRYRATGIYLRDAGLWELVQAHVSGPITPEPPLNPPDSAAVLEEGG